ncbi:PREDICTED: uncharacterized protein LOC104811117 [Tarenaya hassleriana]|uniref:uncharacterized protein LOC104811117 n=1 Tax=Tarenaya hassleriana TaxID=28532 RepID=UPI00053C25FD|nr:PREDICTED: uncharacterized protein LOC104811117 [Tarenaya hassleriana]
MKRKLKTPEGSSKKTKKKKVLEIDEESPWGNLELILSLQDRELAVEKKVDLAFGFVKEQVGERSNYKDEECEAVSMSRLIVFVSDWIQSLLISSGKKSKADGDIDIDPCLDVRCWEIFKFCLRQSPVLHVSLNVSKNLLKAIGYVAKNLLSLLNMSAASEEIFTGQGFEVYSSVVACIGLLFSSKSGLLNDNLDLWFSTVEPVLKLTHKVLAENIEDGLAGAFVLQFSCFVLEPFSEFLRVHPTKKNGFRDFLDKLLEPLLDVLGLLHLQIDGNKITSESGVTLLKFIHEILSHGLFHSAHIDGFLGLRGTEKYAPSEDGKSNEKKTVLISYHRYLFAKLESILAMKKDLALSCVGDLFSLFVNRVTTQLRASNQLEEGRITARTMVSTRNQTEEEPPNRMHNDRFGNDIEPSHLLSSLSAETRKSIFDFFLHLMEPAVLEMDNYIESGSEMADDIYCVLKSSNILLSSLARERIYVRTEDASKGACLCFLKKIFTTLVSIASQLLEGYTNVGQSQVFVSSAKELITAIGHLLEIEYEVIENDLVSLWLIILLFLEISSSPENSDNGCLLTSQTVALGCQLINLFSDLRQVNSVVYALCKAVRLMSSRDGYDGEMINTKFIPPSNLVLFKNGAKLVKRLFSSQDFRLAIHKAIKLISEGQASGCIKSLTTDMSETTEWIKVSCTKTAREEAVLAVELLAGALSEIYSLILDSLTITAGNSILVGLSINNLMDVIRPHLSCLVSSDLDCIEKFLCAITGKRLDTLIAEKKRKINVKAARLYIFFFIRIYMSCRNLYRQVISLMPPKNSKEMAKIMGDSVTACCGNDWVKRMGWNDEGYFSWICQPSASVLDTIKLISDVYLKDDNADCCLLIYTLHGLALQRLVDLNRLVRSLVYVLQTSDNQMQDKMLDEAEISRLRKKSKKLTKRLSVLKREGEDLVDYLLSFIASDFDSEEIARAIDKTDPWGVRISVIDKKSLPSVLWWILSQHIDVWCSHAVKRKLKDFLSWIIHASIPSMLKIENMGAVVESDVHEDTRKKKIGVQHISLELIHDSALYELEFVRRYLGSSFSRILENTALELFKEVAKQERNCNSSPEWAEVLVLLESLVASLSGEPQSETRVEENASQLNCMKFTACRNLLNLFCRIPREYMTKKSLQQCTSHILYIERSIVFGMLRCQHKLSPGDEQILFSLFITCRRTLKSIFMTSCGKMVAATKLPWSDGSLLALWLLKSVQAAVTYQGTFTKEFTSRTRDCIVSLMDHTSYIFLTLSKYQFSKAMPLFIAPKNMSGEQPASQEPFEEEKGMNVFDDHHLDDSATCEDSRQVILLLESLTKQAESLFISFKDELRDGKPVFECETLTLNKIASVFGCFGGLLWGLASAASEKDMQKSHQKTKLKWKLEPLSKLSCSINVLSNFIQFFMHYLFQNGGLKPEIQTDADWGQLIANGKDSNSLVEINLEVTEDVKKRVLESLIKDDSSEAALVLRQLLITSAAVLRLNMHVDGIALSPNLVSVLTGVSYVLLSSLADVTGAPKEFSFIWLDGALKFLEELGNYFSSSNPALDRDLYSKMIELHLKVIGKCISLQGKEATLASHETGFGTNVVHAKKVSSEDNLSNTLHWLDEFKERLRMSFKAFIQNSSEFHFLAGIQAIERALIGVWEVCPAIYKIQTGNRDGGKISSTAAAAIDCLDLILEHASGRKRVNVVKRHIQSFVSATLSIIVHLRSPFIFFSKPVCSHGLHYPDPGSVILMCVEVLTRISGKHALFQMEAWHVSQTIHMPGALLLDFLQVTSSGLPVSNGNLLSRCDHRQNRIQSLNNLHMDREFSISLYAASCRLLYTLVKHHKSQTEGCIATLQQSVSALLHCLEKARDESGNHLSLKVEEGIRCACFLRRIYEELRQQKEVFKQHCFKFLSTYIWVSSGNGPLKTGIRREVDEALRPGVYALIDCCEPNDLQYLHTVFHEGPCRNTLAALQQEYKLNFKYEGKV